MTPRAAIAAATLLASACGRETPLEQARAGESAAPTAAARPQPPVAAPAATVQSSPREDSLPSRTAAIDAAVARWRAAADLAAAHQAAEEAHNLVVGPASPFYGDADGNGVIAGATAAGLLPGLDGAPGLASAAPNACVTRDVLGGDWSDPARRWAILRTAIARWAPGNNTFPKLPSHPQRIVGWATLTLASDSLATARDYAGHAKIHADVTRRAVMECRR